ncbi:MAG: ribosomal protein S18-alanine N-acetyltransferase [Anaerolineales bacterium]
MTDSVTITAMVETDIPQVAAIDRISFPQPWSENSYRFELRDNEHSHFIVALDPHSIFIPNWLDRLRRRTPTRRVLGYAGYWLAVDEVHINTIAVHPEWRRRGIGDRLLQTLMADARKAHARSATLEVRVGNEAAQTLYRKYGFEPVGQRPRYYRDGEDALLMTAKWGV